MIIGLGTIINFLAIVAGALIGTLLGDRLPKKTRDVVTDALGLMTLLVAGLSIIDITKPEFEEAVGPGMGVLVVLGSLILGGITGSYWRLEDRFESIGKKLKKSLKKRIKSKDENFVEGFVSASLLFVVGPLAILGSISDGLGNGIEQLALKSSLDFFASIAFAASLGIGVAFSALAVGVYQGLFTVLGFGLGDVLNEAQVIALTVTGGLLLVGVKETGKDIETIRSIIENYEQDRGRKLKYAFLSDFNFKGERRNDHCYMHMVKPFLFTDGYVYACPSAELSIENNYNYVPESQFAVCDIDGIEEFYSKPPTLRHHACHYCKYAIQNELIDDILTETEHNDFA